LSLEKLFSELKLVTDNLLSIYISISTEGVAISLIFISLILPKRKWSVTNC